MDNQTFHLDQYKMLREEIMQNIREIYRTTLAGAVAAGSVYSWILLHKQSVASRTAWFIAPCALVICAVRCAHLTISTKSIAKYLRRIEEVVFGQDAKLPG